jgi:hypothetical protein
MITSLELLFPSGFIYVPLLKQNLLRVVSTDSLSLSPPNSPDRFIFLPLFGSYS